MSPAPDDIDIRVTVEPAATVVVDVDSPVIRTVGAANLGPQGPPGPEGPQGPQGPAGSSTGPAGGDLGGNYPDPTVVKSTGDFVVGGKQEIAGLAGQPGLFITGTPSPVIRSNVSGVIWNNRLASADAQPSFKVDGYGKIEWGAGGATAPDTTLYRSAADSLKTDDSFEVAGKIYLYATTAGIVVVNSSNYMLRSTLVAGDANNAFRVDGLGKHEWGPGGATALDTTLYRFAAGTLRTDGALHASYFRGRPATTAAPTLQSIVAAESWPRFEVRGDGRLLWGDGTGATGDTNLYRVQADYLKTDDTFQVGNQIILPPTGGVGVYTAAGNEAYRTHLSGADPTPTFHILGNGKLEWGPGGGVGVDTNLYRVAAEHLRTDGTFSVKVSSVGKDFFDALVVTSDANFRFRVIPSMVGGGTPGLLFGDGTAVADTNLYRSGANQLKTDGTLSVVGDLRVGMLTSYQDFANIGMWLDNSGYMSVIRTTVGGVFFTSLQNDTTNRFTLRSDGQHQWGDGTNPVDTNLYRYTASQIRTDGTFWAKAVWLHDAQGQFVARAQSSVANIVFATRLSTPDTQDRFEIGADGKLLWGDGASALDTNLYRSGADTLTTDDKFAVGSPAGLLFYPSGFGILSTGPPGNSLLRNYAASGDAQYTYKITGSGVHEWGVGGSTAPDTNLYRSAADTLKTDDAFVCAKHINFSASIAAASVPNNSIFLDSADNALKKKDNAGVVTVI